MCEPSHSIIQTDDPHNPPDDDNYSSPQATFAQNRLLQGLGTWAKKIKNWLHLSQLGKGHSETLKSRVASVSSWAYDDVFTRYEAHWWDRKVVFDGGKLVYKQREERLAAATKYAEAVSIGGLSQLRNFLEVSMQNTDRIEAYSSMFREKFLNFDGRVELENRSKKVFKVPLYKMFYLKKNEKQVESWIKFLMGFTRQRKLLVPEWADDDKLWLPKPKLT